MLEVLSVEVFTFFRFILRQYIYKIPFADIKQFVFIVLVRIKINNGCIVMISARDFKLLFFVV